MNIPEQYQIKEIVTQNTYLVGGELKSWTGETAEVYYTISSTENYKPTLLGTIPTLGEKEALEALDAAVNAYNKGQVAGREQRRLGEVCDDPRHLPLQRRSRQSSIRCSQ